MKEENKDLPGSLQRLSDMRNEMIGLDNSVIAEETKLSDTKRSQTRQALSLKLGALEELAEKMQIVCHIGRLLVAEIPTDETPTGHPRAQYKGKFFSRRISRSKYLPQCFLGYETTDELMNEATQCLQDVIFNPVQLNSTDADARNRNQDNRSPNLQSSQFGNSPAALPLSHLSNSQAQYSGQQRNSNEYQNGGYSNPYDGNQHNYYSNQPQISTASLPLPLPPIDSGPDLRHQLPELSLTSPIDGLGQSNALPARDLGASIPSIREVQYQEPISRNPSDHHVERNVDRSSLAYIDDVPVDEEEEAEMLDGVREEEEEGGALGHSRRYDAEIAPSQIQQSNYTEEFTPTQTTSSLPLQPILPLQPSKPSTIITPTIEQPYIRPYVPKDDDGAYHGASTEPPASLSLYQKYSTASPALITRSSTSQFGAPTSTASVPPTLITRASMNQFDSPSSSPLVSEPPTTKYDSSSYTSPQYAQVPPVTPHLPPSPLANSSTYSSPPPAPLVQTPTSPTIPTSTPTDYGYNSKAYQSTPAPPPPTRVDSTLSLGSKHGDLYVSNSPGNSKAGAFTGLAGGASNSGNSGLGGSNTSGGNFQGMGTTGYNTRTGGAGGDTSSISSGIEGNGARRINAGAFRRVAPPAASSGLYESGNGNGTSSPQSSSNNSSRFYPGMPQNQPSSGTSQSDAIRDLYRANSASSDAAAAAAAALSRSTDSAVSGTGTEGEGTERVTPSRFDVSPLVVNKANRRASMVPVGYTP